MSDPAGIQVLYVDDEPDVVELSGEMLEREDTRFSVETATSPSDGLDRLTAKDFDCIISDYQMPGQNGIEFLNAIREVYPDLPFILYTGKGSEKVASEAISAGVTDYLKKGSGTSQYTVLANRVTNAVEKYRSRLQLEETNEQLSEIADATNDVLYLFNGDWSELLFVNSAYETVWGGSVAELKANPRSFLNLVHPDDREKARESMERISNGERDVIEYRILTGEDDEVRWIRGDMQPILDNDGNVERIVGSTSDITEIKKRERELERVNDLFEQAQNIANFGAWETDLRNDEGWWTEHVNQIYGLPNVYEPDPGEGIEYFHPEDQPVIRDAFDRATEAGQPYDLELRVVDVEETFKWVRTRGKPEVEDGDVVRVRGTIQDITKRKEREAELQQERARLDALFQHSTDAVVFTEFVDGDPVIRDVNPTFEKKFGYDEESAVGRPIDELVVPDESDRMREASELNRRIEAGDLVETEVRRQTVDGVRDFLVQSIPLKPGESGTPTYVIYSDITERKERERQLQRERERLDRFASVVSHDLRNPLNVATGRLDLAMKECESEHLQPVTEALERMETLIEDVLRLARAGEVVGEMESVDLAELGHRCWQNVETKSGALRIDTDAVIKADESRLQQLVENLFKNAAEHGSNDVTVTLGTLDGGFYLEDDGPGIPEGQRDDVFETGYSSRKVGTGFGLSIVKEIVEAHDWKIRVTDGADGGARFEIIGVEYVAE